MTAPERSRGGAALSVRRPRHDVISLLDEDPDLGVGLDASAWACAERAALAPVVAIDPPVWDVGQLGRNSKHGWLGLYVIDGMLLRCVRIGRRPACEMFGPGDLIRPWDADGVYAPLPISVEWRVLAPTRLAVLDAGFARRIAQWPELGAAISGRVAQRARSLTLLNALTHLPRAYARLLILVWVLAERWGRVTPAGVQLTLPVTHEMLAMMIGTQRPTVTIALQRLARAGLLTREGRDRWLLTTAAIDSLSKPESLELAEVAVL
jgi:CRP/FNR family cyclic AMP-dependent transcriptional regulator